MFRRARPRALPLPAWPRLAFTLLAFVALAIQSLVVQTHIHHGTAGIARVAGIAALSDDFPVIVTSPGGSKTHAPRDPFAGSDDPSNCALCQAFAHSGQFVHSAAVLAYIPAWVSVHFIVFKDVLPQLLAVSHSWQGRAPPQD